MAVPKKRTSKSKRDMRRSHHALEQRFTVLCSNCGAPKQRHRVCPSCGFYRGRLVKVVESKNAESASA